jgi:hypothetical protein
MLTALRCEAVFANPMLLNLVDVPERLPPTVSDGKPVAVAAGDDRLT